MNITGMMDELKICVPRLLVQTAVPEHNWQKPVSSVLRVEAVLETQEAPKCQFDHLCSDMVSFQDKCCTYIAENMTSPDLMVVFTAKWRGKGADQ